VIEQQAFNAAREMMAGPQKTKYTKSLGSMML
jgi:hypothetical protein